MFVTFPAVMSGSRVHDRSFYSFLFYSFFLFSFPFIHS